MESIQKTLKIAVTPETAFKKFLEEFNAWWPKEYTWSQDKLEEIRIEKKENGLCTEIGPYGFRCDWGRVTTLVEPKKIGLKWQISAKREPVPNPDHASDVTIEFLEEGDTTHLKFQHANFKNHGEAAEEYQSMMDSDYGWTYILALFKKYCEEG